VTSRHAEQLLEAEPDPGEETGASDIFAGDQRHDLWRGISGGHDQLGNFLALRDRRDERPASGYASGSGRRRPAGTVIARLRGDQSFARASELDLAVPTLAPCWNSGLQSGAEPIGSAASILDARILARQARDDFDQQAPILFSGTGEAIARLISVTGLRPSAPAHVPGSGCGSAGDVWLDQGLSQVKLGSE
jgi:hypothetical protein